MVNRRAVRLLCWLFALLALVALSSPPGSTHDEWYHLASIWCAQGEEDPYCKNIGYTDELGYSANLNFGGKYCQANPRQVLLCPPESQDDRRFAINQSLYPAGFYLLLSPLKSNSLEKSVLAMRWFSASVTSVVIVAGAVLLPVKHRTALLLMLLSAVGSSGYFLLASINPSAWVLSGIGMSLLSLHAAISDAAIVRVRRVALFGLWLFSSAIACISRWDAIPYACVTSMLVIAQFTWRRFPRIRKRVAFFWITTPIIAWLSFERFSPFLPIFHYMSPTGERKNISALLYTYLPGQPNNIAFYSENLLQALPNALRALGTVPTVTLVRIPELVYVTGLVILGYLMVKTLNPRSLGQKLAFLFMVLVMALTVAAQVALLDSRDFGGIEPRYIHPLLLVAAGWWFLHSPGIESFRVSLKPIVVAAVASFALGNFAVTERFVDHQTDGIRILPEGVNQWWWTNLPFGPNVVILVAPLCLWLFFKAYEQSFYPRDPQSFDS